MSTEQRSTQLPWQGLLALAAAMVGTVWYLAPLNTSRPSERGGVSLRLSRAQDVDARLWQDPLATAFAHDEQVRAIDQAKDKLSADREEPLHSASALSCQIELAMSRREGLLVLPVLVSGGAYAEYGENRLRARRAVLEALGTNGWSPKDGEHIGYVRVPLLDSTAAGILALPCEQPPPSPKEQYFVLPYEWCGPAFAGSANLRNQVLILWVREDEFNGRPLHGLATLLRYLGIEPNLVKVIGPRTSTALRDIVEEVTTDGFQLERGVGVAMFSPTATVSEELLLRGKESLGFSSVKALLKEKLKDLAFHRVTLNDGDVCRALIGELARRRVHADLRQPPPHHRGWADHIALISEWDTFYGRALPQTFAREVSGWDLARLEHDYPENIHAFHYLRGIDGMVPGAPVQQQTARTGEKSMLTDRPRETIEGLNQADYLRRLAMQLQDKHRELIRNGRGGLKAVGVLGSDVYDKLLVLKALRSALPGVLFFTNNLDARFGHADEWHCARNLIVGSPFGLRLNETWPGDQGVFDLQGKILPFRDSYQTATYAATLFASNAAAAQVLNNGRTPLGAPRLFEIAQSGPYELPRSMPPENEHSNLHPTCERHWWSAARVALALGTALSIAALIAWIALMVRGERCNQKGGESGSRGTATANSSQTTAGAAWGRLCEEIRDFRSWGVFVTGALVAWLAVEIVAYAHRSNGEPFLWMEGISIWPTETVRLLAAFMAWWFLFKTSRALFKNEAEMREQFDLISPEGPSHWPSASRFSRLWWRQAIALLSVRKWLVQVDGKVDAQELWRHYVRAGRWGVRALRVGPLTLCYISAGLCLMFLLGEPGVPGRGEASFKWDRFFLILAVGSSVYLTFFVADATMLNRRLIDYLVKERTKWPIGAYRNVRKRWRVLDRKEESVPVPAPSWWRRALLRMQFCRTEQPNKGTGSSHEELPPEPLLDEYLDIDLIARRTAVVGELIYYPFIVITLLIVSRISLFDDWTWPVGLFIVIGGNGGYAAWSALKLRRTAEDARQIALTNLNDILIARTAVGEGGGAEAQTARETIAIIKAEHRGAFAAISRHPLIGALLLPSGGAGIWALTQYLPGLF